METDDAIITIYLSNYCEEAFYQWFDKSADRWKPESKKAPRNVVIGVEWATCAEDDTKAADLLARHVAAWGKGTGKEEKNA